MIERKVRLISLALLCGLCLSCTLNIPTSLNPRPGDIKEIPLSAIKTLPTSKGERYYDPNHTPIGLYDTQGNASTMLGPYFQIRDFAHTGAVAFRYARIDPMLATCLNRARAASGKAIRVESSYRTWEYNNQLVKEGQKASRKSFHMSGKAADISLKISQTAFARIIYKECGCGTGLGVGKNWFHIDTRGANVIPWGYGTTSKVQLANVRRVRKSMCGAGRRDTHELGALILETSIQAIEIIGTTIEKWLPR